MSEERKVGEIDFLNAVAQISCAAIHAGGGVPDPARLVKEVAKILCETFVSFKDFMPTEKEES